MSAVLALALAAATPAVCHVRDGDTVVLCDGRAVRLSGVDTPETRRSPACNTAAKRAKNWCSAPKLADRATAELRRWLRRGPYVVELNGRCDIYQRHIATLRRGREDVRDVLLRAGLARRDATDYHERRCGT